MVENRTVVPDHWAGRGGSRSQLRPPRCLRALSSTQRRHQARAGAGLSVRRTRCELCLQGPLPNTCGHFWEMVWEQKSRGVVMLNRVMEKGSVSPSCPVFTSLPARVPIHKGDVCLFISSGCFLFLLEKSKAAVRNHVFIVNKSDKQVSLKERRVKRPLPWSPPHPGSGLPRCGV